MSRESAAAPKCAYCAAFSNKLEHDHIPPRSIFAKPSAFITVPACTACHRATTKDDEYFRLMLAMRHDVHEHPDVSGGVLDSVLRSLTYPQAARFSQSFLRTVREVAVKTPEGLYLGNVGTYEANIGRVVSVVARIVRGLFFHHIREPLGPSYDIRVIEDSFVDWGAMPSDRVEKIRNLANALARSKTAKIGDAFEYARWCAPEDVRVSGWLLKFYGKIVFLAITGPERDPQT